MNEKKPLFHTPKVWTVGPRWVWPIRILLFCVAGYFAREIYYAYSTGVIHGKHQDFLLDDSPIFFGVMLILYFGIVTGAIWQSFRVRKE